ncbi:unnamed protein product [Fusarium fujikuroi]|nr:unnamed protein product [Fusarium fujikuroi]
MSTDYVLPPDHRATQHEGTSSLAINNTFPRRFMTLVALKTSARFYKHDGPCILISKSLIVKKGSFVHLTEAATMQFVAANTSIPVPTVHCSFVHKKRAHIVMQRIRGTSLAEAWKPLSEADLASIFAQLRHMLEELRALVPPNSVGVESCTGGSLRDSRIPRSRPRFGPLKSIQHFHRWLWEDLETDSQPDHIEDQDWKDIKEMATKQNGPWPTPLFTHGDLNPFNILVRGDQVVGLIDWEFAGWYPYYWEYTSAWAGKGRLPSSWIHILRSWRWRRQGKDGGAIFKVEKPRIYKATIVPMRGWIYEEIDLPNVRNTNSLLARIIIAKVEDEKRLVEIIRSAPVIQNDPNWRCRTWVADVLSRIASDGGRAIGTSELDWAKIERVPRDYVANKTATGRYLDPAVMPLPKPTWDMLQGKEIVP